jgi:hypothetical protein
MSRFNTLRADAEFWMTQAQLLRTAFKAKRLILNHSAVQGWRGQEGENNKMSVPTD